MSCVIVGGVGGMRIRVAVVCFVCGDPAYRDTLVCVIVRMWVCMCIIVWVEWLCGCVRMRVCIIVCVCVCVGVCLA